MFKLDWNDNAVWDRQYGGDAVLSLGGFPTDVAVAARWAPRPDTILAARGIRQAFQPETSAFVEPLTDETLAPVVERAVDIWSAAHILTDQPSGTETGSVKNRERISELRVGTLKSPLG